MKVLNNNVNVIRILFFLTLLFGKIGMETNAQTTITGKIADKDSGEELIGANIEVKKNGNFIQGETTDIDGNFSIRVDPGTYDVEVSYTGYPTQRIEGVIAPAGVATKVDVQMEFREGQLVDWIYTGCCICKPLIRQDETTTGKEIDSEQIKNLPTRDIKKIITITPGVSFTQ